jgi:adenylate cyclase
MNGTNTENLAIAANCVSNGATDLLATLRLRLRAPLHQIVSYAEMISEDTGATERSDLSACLGEILGICESVLQQTSGFPQDVEHSTGFVAGLRDQLLEHSRNITALSERLQGLSLWLRDGVPREEAGKLRAAARRFDDIVRAMGPAAEGPIAGPMVPRNLEKVAFRIQLPRGNGRVLNEHAKKPAHRAVILVVDDDEGNRDVLSRRLLRDGYEVMLAETGRQALRMARRYDFDLILLDIMMPEMDGMTVLAELKRDAGLCHLPIIMVSAMDEIDSVVHCIELGADDYLMKPFNPVLLRARISALLERKHLRDEEVRKTADLKTALAEVQMHKTKTEDLLRNILPASVAEELQTQGAVQPMYFEDVTIAFADFVGFTVSTEHLPAEDLVHVLHEYFTAFDNIIRRYGLEKLKTIGDCYMFAGGLPERTRSHPVDVILAAFEMIRVTQQLSKQGPVDWKLRIGLHTGPVIAGVVGIYKFAFDIWGESVNFSSRMESSGAPGRINLSLNTFQRIKDFFACEKRGKVRTKDGRDVEMYFAEGLASSLLANKNLPPATCFEQRYRTYFRRDPPPIPDIIMQFPGTPTSD